MELIGTLVRRMLKRGERASETNVERGFENLMEGEMRIDRRGGK
jgi:hypothetical protein